jgi:hypothetical protein
MSRSKYENREKVKTLAESNKENQVGSPQELDLVQENARHPGDRQKNVRPLDDSDEEQVNPLKKGYTEKILALFKSGHNKKVQEFIDQKRKIYEGRLLKLEGVRKEFDRPQKELEESYEYSPLKTPDGYSYQKSIDVYRDTRTGELTRAFTIKIQQGDGAPVEIKTSYSGEAADLARLCNEKLDGFIQNNYHDALAQAKLKIEEETKQAKKQIDEETEQAKLKIEEETKQAKKQIDEEMAPQYTALETTPDPAARARLDAERTQKIAALDAERTQKIAALDAERTQKIAEVKKKAGTGLRKFLEKHGGRRLDSELLEELQWVQGMDVATREIKRRIASSEDKLETNAENLQRITTEINEKIQEVKRLLPSSESHALAGSSEASGLSHRPLTLENFDQKIAAYMKDRSRGLSAPILKDISDLASLLAADTSQYPESQEAKDRLKISKTLADIGLKLVERQYKLDEPFEMLEKWHRYTASHYGKRLMYERHLIDYFQTVSEAAGEHSKASHNEQELVKRVDLLYRGGLRKVNLHPFYPGFNDIDEYTRTTLAKIRNIAITQETKDIAERVQTTLEQLNNTQGAKDLDEHIQKLEKLRNIAITQETKDIAEHIKTTLAQLRSFQEAKDFDEHIKTTLEKLRSIDNTQSAKDFDEHIQTLEKLRSIPYIRDAKDLNKHIQTLEKLRSIPYIQEAKDLDEHIKIIQAKLESIQKAKDFDEHIKQILEKLRNIPNTQDAKDIESKLWTDLKNLAKQSPDIYQLNDAQQLQIALGELEQARLASVEKKGEYEKALVQKEAIQKLVELAKGRDDANDNLDLANVNAIKETDKAALQYLRTTELEAVKHFYALRLERHKEFNKEEEDIRHFLINLDKMEIGNEIQQKRIATMYWLALFGSGDQAALVSMTRDANAEFNAFMGLFR